MPSPEQGFVLVVRVWFHDGVPVARILADPAPGPPAGPRPVDPPEGSATVAGRDAIIAAVSDWVNGLDPAT